MERLKTLHDPTHGNLLQHLKPHATTVELIVLVAVPAILLATFTPRPLFLPVLSLAALAVAGLAALVAWAGKAEWRGNRATIWEIAGAFAFVGGAAAAFCQTETVLQLFGHAVVP